jgi:hypothetical protein
MAYVKWIGAGLIAAALIVAGWKVNGWRIDAAQASIAKAELRAEIKRRIDSEVAGREIQAKLDAANAKINARVKAFQTKVKDNAPNLDCLVPDDIAGELQSLRAGQ